MIVDASALLAIFLNEPEGSIFETTLKDSEVAYISPVNCLEVSMRLDWIWGDAAAGKLDALLDAFKISVDPIDRIQSSLAQDAFRRFGKGRHKAALNMGDCFAYALAKAKGMPLLFKGNDFAQTDLESAI
ncbi:MAG: type II toxin-antitoxin system VapC family toxin [Rhizobiaceae bacterium]